VKTISKKRRNPPKGIRKPRLADPALQQIEDQMDGEYVRRQRARKERFYSWEQVKKELNGRKERRLARVSGKN